MNKYQDFVVSMEPPSLAALSRIIFEHTPRDHTTVSAELLDFANEIEARMQHLAAERPAKATEEDWLK